MNKMMKSLMQVVRLFLLLLGFSLVFSTGVQAQTPTPNHPVPIYFFWGDGCPHCAAAKPYLESLQTRFPEVTLFSYEVYYDEGNQQIYMQMADKFELEQLAVPALFIGPYDVLGYSEALQSDIETMVTYCILNGCEDAAEGVLIGSGNQVAIQSQSTLTPTPDLLSTETPFVQLSEDVSAESQVPMLGGQSLELPWIGKIDLAKHSVILSTILIAFVDGFNPCSLWVLSMLLAVTLHTGSRKKMLLIGLVFVSVTAFIYALFIAGLFSVLKIASFIGWIQGLVAMIALFFGIINIKDYFWYKEGISFTVSDDKKPGIYKMMRRVTDASQSIGGLIGATVVLAAGVSLVEFSCTAGLPVLWTNLLTTQAVEPAQFILLLILYMLIYQLDELVIFFSAVITLKATRLEEKNGRVLKLMGGMLMASLSAVMIFNPALMNSLVNSILIFAAAFLATLLILLIHRVILPHLGIRLGTEFKDVD
jgi:glutaredoxin